MRVNGACLCASRTSRFCKTNYPAGKNWRTEKAPLRSTVGSKDRSAFAQRQAKTQALVATKAIVKELKDEKEAERQRRITTIRERREAKEEKERVEKLQAKMHKKRVERLKKREKRNKLLHS